mmetsp:Transcript_81586/g.174845  ORF Transcript_81586/g.174845 Transcript_81586/m.174845 type:complete len:168 (-) Transcript_81586:111-614(-)
MAQPTGPSGLTGLPGTGPAAGAVGILSQQSITTLFRDFQGSLHALTQETEAIKRAIANNDENLRHEIEEIHSSLEDESFDRKDNFDKLRMEFEVFAHRKAEKVVQECEEFTKEQLVKDSEKTRQLNDVARDVDRLKLHLQSIGMTWGKLVSSISDPTNRNGMEADEA